MNIIYKVRLTFQQGNSNKEYNVEVEQISDSQLYNVNTSYGRIGSNLNRNTKNNEPLNLGTAMKEAYKLEKAKLKKGYLISSKVDRSQELISADQREADLKIPAPGLDDIQINPLMQDSTGLEPNFVVNDVEVYNSVVNNIVVNHDEQVITLQLLNFVSPERAAAIIDEEWLETYYVQIKADGERRPVRCKNGELEAYNKRGTVVKLNPDFLDDVTSLAGGKDLLIDCEDMGSQGLYIFDVLAYDGFDYSKSSFEERTNGLRQISLDADKAGLSNITVLMPIAIDSAEALHNVIENSKANLEEGIVLRRGSSLYTGGRPNKEGDALKIKNVNSASVIVLEKTPNKRSVKVGLYNTKNQLVEMGKVTIPSNHDVPASGEIVEVQYLYVNGKNGALYQPVYKGVRTHELIHEECNVSQLIYKKEIPNAA